MTGESSKSNGRRASTPIAAAPMPALIVATARRRVLGREWARTNASQYSSKVGAPAAIEGMYFH
jgi:hypothetical protein